jgi:hypothetical protein
MFVTATILTSHVEHLKHSFDKIENCVDMLEGVIYLFILVALL